MEDKSINVKRNINNLVQNSNLVYQVFNDKQ